MLQTVSLSQQQQQLSHSLSHCFKIFAAKFLHLCLLYFAASGSISCYPGRSCGSRPFSGMWITTFIESKFGVLDTEALIGPKLTCVINQCIHTYFA